MKKSLVFVFVLILTVVVTVSVSAQGSTSPVCTIEEFEQQKALNSELYDSCLDYDGAFLCLHNPDSDELSIECRALSRVDEPEIESEEKLYPVQNIEVDGSRTDWFLDWFTFSKDPLLLPLVEGREKVKNDLLNTYNLCREKGTAFVVKYDINKKDLPLVDCVFMYQDSQNPAKIECEEGVYPFQNYIPAKEKTTPWYCGTGSSTIPITVIQK